MINENLGQMPEQIPEQIPESMWEAKPWWCQPWSIVLTGVMVPLASWVLLHQWWITAPVAGVMAVWWLLFLVLVPAQYTAAVREHMGKGEV